MKKPRIKMEIFDQGQRYVVRFWIGNQGFDTDVEKLEGESNLQHARFRARMLYLALKHLSGDSVEVARRKAYRKYPVKIRRRKRGTK